MCKNLLSMLLALLLAFVTSPKAFASDYPPFPFLQVQGEAEIEVPPDEVTIAIIVSAFNLHSDIAADEVRLQIMALLAVLEKYSVPDDAITSFNLHKDIERAREDRVETKILGYFITRKVRVELTNISNFSDLIADIVKLDNVSSLDADFDVSDRDGMELELMTEAGADARRLAENMVVGMSRSVGEVYSISESSNSSYLARYSLNVAYDSSPRLNISAAYSVSIFQPSTITLRQTMNVIFKLK